MEMMVNNCDADADDDNQITNTLPFVNLETFNNSLRYGNYDL